jgi:hypothetical protein
MHTHEAAQILGETNQLRAAARRAMDSAAFALLIFGGLTLASVPVGLAGGSPAIGAFWFIGGPLGGVLVGVLHARRERALGIGQRSERNWLSVIFAAAIVVSALAALAIDPAWAAVAPQVVALGGFAAIAWLDGHARLGVLGLTLAIIAMAAPAVLGTPAGYILSTVIAGAALVSAGALILRRAP